MSKNPLWWGLGLAVASWVLSLILESGIVLVIGLIITATVVGVMMYDENDENEYYNNTVFPQLKEEWNRRAICMRCGREFELGRPS